MSWLACDWQDYVRLFAGVQQEAAIGESSAAYLWLRRSQPTFTRMYPAP